MYWSIKLRSLECSPKRISIKLDQHRHWMIAGFTLVHIYVSTKNRSVVRGILAVHIGIGLTYPEKGADMIDMAKAVLI